MLKEELVDLVRETQRLKAEQQTVEVKAASKGCPKKNYTIRFLLFLTRMRAG